MERPEKLERVSEKWKNRSILQISLVTIITFFFFIIISLTYYHRSKSIYLVEAVASGLDDAIKRNDTYAIGELSAP